MTNPLLQKYDEIYNQKAKQPEPSYPQENRLAIHQIEILLEDLKTGRATCQDRKIESNQKYLPPMNPLYYGKPDFSPEYLSVYEGDLFTFKIFRRYQ